MAAWPKRRQGRGQGRGLVLWPGARLKKTSAAQAFGEVAEWLKAHAWKACLRETVTWVRIPLSPPILFCAWPAPTSRARGTRFELKSDLSASPANCTPWHDILRDSCVIAANSHAGYVCRHVPHNLNSSSEFRSETRHTLPFIATARRRSSPETPSQPLP